MTHEELSPMAQGYAVAMVESQEFWPDDFEVDFDRFNFAGVEHFLPGANRSIEADCRHFMALAMEGAGDEAADLKYLPDGERYRIGRELWYRRLGRDKGFGTGNEMVDRAMNAAAESLGRPVVGFCSIGYIEHATVLED